MCSRIEDVMTEKARQALLSKCSGRVVFAMYTSVTMREGLKALLHASS